MRRKLLVRILAAVEDGGGLVLYTTFLTVVHVECVGVYMSCRVVPSTPSMGGSGTSGHQGFCLVGRLWAGPLPLCGGFALGVSALLCEQRLLRSWERQAPAVSDHCASLFGGPVSSQQAPTDVPDV